MLATRAAYRALASAAAASLPTAATTAAMAAVASAGARWTAVALPPPSSSTAASALGVYGWGVRGMAGQAGPGGAAGGSTEGVSTEPPAGGDAGAAAGGAGAAPGAEGAPAGDDAALKALQEESAKLKASVGELNATRLRLLAEMENVRGIAKRDVELSKAYALQSFAKRLLDVVDNLGRAVESVPAELRTKEGGVPALANLYEGVSATHRVMLKTLGEFGVVPFGAKGDKFDPNRHEAMMQVPASEEVAADHVAILLKQGFVLKDRVLRPAQVGVAVPS